jgi:nicotinamide-nucleotide amidase
MASKIVTDCSKVIAKHKLTIAFAESATAGRLSSEFSMTPYSGEILMGGIVCYDACMKEDILKVPHKLIEKYTPESAEVSEELARRLKNFIKADIHVAVTGLTTPGGSESPEKPVGTMFIHVLIKNRSIGIREVFKGSEENIVLKAVERTARLIKSELRDGISG